MTHYRSSLGRYAASMRDPDLEAARRLAREKYMESGGDIVLINKKWLYTWSDRKQLDLLAEKAFGVKGIE